MQGRLGGPESGTKNGAPLIVSGEVLRERGRQIRDAIARRAYEMFEQRGRADGRHEDDWLRAEAELLARPKVEVRDVGSAVTVQAELGEFAAGQVEVSVEPRRITIAAARARAAARRRGAAVPNGRPDRAYRAVELPCDVDAADVTVSMLNGRLELALRKPGARQERTAS